MHLATFTTILIIILIIFLPYELVISQFYFIALVIFVFIFMHTPFTLMKKSQRELRAATSFIIVGALYTGYFMTYMNPAIMREGYTPIIIFPALLILGTFLIMAPTVFKPEFFSRNIKYWYLFSIILIGTAAINVIYFYYLSTILDLTIEGIILPPVFVIFFVVECVILIRFIKHEETLGVKGDIGVRGIFTKPEKVTEEEVSISKEKKICLVCKGKVARRNIFLCPECDTFYCSKCSEALEDLENACWVCEAPFDESKPVKLPEKEEEKVIVEDFEKKGKKKQGNKL